MLILHGTIENSFLGSLANKQMVSSGESHFAPCVFCYVKNLGSFTLRHAGVLFGRFFDDKLCMAS